MRTLCLPFVRADTAVVVTKETYYRGKRDLLYADF